MHSANTPTVRTRTSALSATEEQRTPVLDGIARSALVVLLSGIALDTIVVY